MALMRAFLSQGLKVSSPKWPRVSWRIVWIKSTASP